MHLSSIFNVYLSSFVFRLSSKYAFLYPSSFAFDDSDFNRDFIGVLYLDTALAGRSGRGVDFSCAAGGFDEGWGRCVQGAFARADSANSGVFWL